MVVGALAVASFATSAMAQIESTYFFDARSSASAITTPAFPYNVDESACGIVAPLVNGGVRGAAQTIYVSPTYPTNQVETILGPVFPNEDGDADLSTASAYLYAQVNAHLAEDGAATGDVISSIGLDVAVTDHATSTDQVLLNTGWNWNGSPGVSWSGTSNGSASGLSQNNVRAVKVPVTSGPLYNTTGALQPTNLYKVGALTLKGAPRTAPSSGVGTYGVKMSVDSLLITRVFSSGGAATPVEHVAFGYAGASPEALSGGATGNTEGGTSATDDATIVVQPKGDFDQDGILTTNDLGALLFLTDDPDGGGPGVPGDCDGNNVSDVGRYAMYVFDTDNDLILTSNDLGVWLALSDDIGCPG
jgi:hypothetical protein